MQGLRPLYWIMDSGRDNFLSKHRDNHLNHEGQNSRASDLTLGTENCGKHFVTKSGRALADWTNSYNTVFPLGFFFLSSNGRKLYPHCSLTSTVPACIFLSPVLQVSKDIHIYHTNTSTHKHRQRERQRDTVCRLHQT